ncbi:MAG: V-type ATP synthase subunit F [Candidatus Thorarchaeota archaeon]
MPEQQIHVIGTDEIITLLGLLGINGTVIDDNKDFMKQFNELVENPAIYLIIIALDLPNNIIETLIDFKLNRRKPFIFYLPNLFTSNHETKDLFISKVSKSLGKILT